MRAVASDNMSCNQPHTSTLTHATNQKPNQLQNNNSRAFSSPSPASPATTMVLSPLLQHANGSIQCRESILLSETWCQPTLLTCLLRHRTHWPSLWNNSKALSAVMLILHHQQQQWSSLGAGCRMETQLTLPEPSLSSEGHKMT